MERLINFTALKKNGEKIELTNYLCFYDLIKLLNEQKALNIITELVQQVQ